MMKTMKAITVWQPWASLLACGAKKYETRSWPTKYKGPIAIHAAAKRPLRQEEMPWEIFNAITTALAKHYGACRFDWHLGGTKINADGSDNGFCIPLGAIIATAELVQCWEIKKINDNGHPFATAVDHDGAHFLTITRDGEQLFGDWTPGRYAWELKNVQMLPEPIPAKGKQGLWNCEVPEVSTDDS